MSASASAAFKTAERCLDYWLNGNRFLISVLTCSTSDTAYIKAQSMDRQAVRVVYWESSRPSQEDLQRRTVAVMQADGHAVRNM